MWGGEAAPHAISLFSQVLGPISPMRPMAKSPRKTGLCKNSKEPWKLFLSLLDIPPKPVTIPGEQPNIGERSGWASSASVDAFTTPSRLRGGGSSREGVLTQKSGPWCSGGGRPGHRVPAGLLGKIEGISGCLPGLATGLALPLPAQGRRGKPRGDPGDKARPVAQDP